MTTFHILPYKAGSESVKNLMETLDIKRLKLRGSKWKPAEDKHLINWGSSNPPKNTAGGNFINKPEAVGVASNKKTFFKTLSENDDVKDFLPPFTFSRKEAEKWLQDGYTMPDGVVYKTVVAREKLQGHSGEGIVLIENMEDMVDAPLYTLYIPKKHEFRFHVMDGRIIDTTRKARKRDVPDEEVNWKVRNLAGGFTYAREDCNPNPSLRRMATSIIKALDLDFGAVDIIWNERREVGYVLEVNTAPGLTGTTLECYTEGFKRMMTRIERGEEAPAKPFRWADYAHLI